MISQSWAIVTASYGSYSSSDQQTMAYFFFHEESDRENVLIFATQAGSTETIFTAAAVRENVTTTTQNSLVRSPKFLLKTPEQAQEESMPTQRSSFKAGTSSRKKAKNKKITPLSKCRDLVLVDSQPLRQKVWRQYQNAVKRVEKAANELKQFRDIDLDRYQLWCDGTFAAEIIKLRSAQHAVHELEEWLDQIHNYAGITGMSLTRSAKTLAEAKAEGRLDELWTELAQELRDESAKANSKQGMDHQDGYELEDLLDEIFAEADDEFSYDMGSYHDANTRAPKHPEDAEAQQSLRNLYHQLALRLHPDTNPNQTQEQSQLFQEAQAAYREQDIESLEEIWKKVEGKGEGIFSWKTAAISEIISRKKTLDRRGHEINGELRIVRKHPAWNFSKIAASKTALATLTQSVRRALKEEQRELDAEWAALNQLLQNIEKTSRKAPRNRRPRT